MTLGRNIGPDSVLHSAQEFGIDSSEFRVVIVHGSMDRQGSFSRLCRSLPDVACLTYDRRGYARSNGLAGPFDISRHTADLLEVLQVVRADSGPVAVVGHSFGGVVALAAASERPDLVDGLVIYESPMSWEPWWSRSSGGAAALEAADRPEVAAENFLRRFIGDERWDRLPERTRTARRAEGVVLVGELASLRRGRPYEFDRVECPVVVGVGTRAAEHVQRGSRLLADECGSIPLVVLEGAHHNAHSSRPMEFAEKLVRPLLALIGRSG
ncbi:MAG: hypothetical protein B7C54_09035 [Acidimicrobiales bacterium mtb01]|nr:alpha/beta hydrolase [Actinomycetota bacterium]TEX45247.1 MAG: hypothetical protein B7C54_09035 [Acidimicrobiales bacterium mtb01]